MQNSTIKSYLDWATIGRKSILLYIIGFILVIFISLILGQMFFIVGEIIIPLNSPSLNIFKFTFFSFIFSFISVPLLIGLLHNRPWWSIAMPEKKIEFKNFFIGFFIVLSINFILNIIGYFYDPSKYVYSGFNGYEWLLLFFLAFLAFFIQVATEEMVYRGYISQFIFRITKSPILVVLLSSIVFSLPHFGNITGANGIFAVLPYIEMGIMFGWLAYRSGSLWMSIGAHMANNWFITMFVGSNLEKIHKLSLFTKISETSSPESQSISSFIYALLVIVVAEIIMKITKTRVTDKKEQLID